jgi:hypothetical protein
MRSTVETILGGELTPIQWSQMQLSVNDGGHGLGIHTMTPYAAYAASFYSAYPVVHGCCPSIAEELTKASVYPLMNLDLSPVKDFVEAVAKVGFKNLDCVQFLGIEPSGSGKLQSKLMEAHRALSRISFVNALEAQGNAEDLATYHSNATAEGSAYIDAKAKSARLRMSNGSMLLAMKRRYRIEVCSETVRCTCKGKPLVGIHGIHFMSKCAKGNERIMTHNDILDVVSAFAQSAGCRVNKEVKGLFQNVDPDNRERPDGTISGLRVHPKLVFDVKVTEKITSHLTMNQAKVADRAVRTGEAQKNLKFKDKVSSEGGMFVPLSMSTAGGMGADFKTLVDELVKHSADYNQIHPAAIRTYWLRRISVTLQNAIANCFFKHVGRANTPAFYDESLHQGLVVEQSYEGPASVSNRRGLG